ncbi:DUF6932 family protein [Ectopseudomonas hydrolytica]|uniref:DUF6932 family protein n=1 Tax=Ectopseudomonas hydrolytica TaxID=2493633 RepID=UPI00376EF0AE
MTPHKIDHQPLLPAGFHVCTLESLRRETVERFPDSGRRRELFASLSVYLDLLSSTGLRAEVWIDGSFMSVKPEPDDIDMVVAFDPDSARSTPMAARPALLNLLDTNFVAARFGLHLFRVSQQDADGVAYWTRLFGTMRDERTPKGMAVLRINND